MAKRDECRCAPPDYHRARIVYYFGRMHVTSHGRWCARCMELVPDDGPFVRFLVWAWLRVSEELPARVDCIEHEHQTEEVMP